MAFFEVPPLHDLRGDASMHRLVYPSQSRPGREFGASIPLNKLLFHTERFAAAIPSLTVFSNGIRVSVTIHGREEVLESPRLMYGFAGITSRHVDESGQLLDSVLRFGIEFADGRRTTNLDRFADRLKVGQLSMIHIGGGGGAGVWDHAFFITALPPPGVMRFVVEWPQAGVAETSVDVDTDDLLAAAASITALWPQPADELIVAEPRVQEAVLLAAVTAALGPSVVAVTGIRARGIRLVGRYPDTQLVVEYDELEGDRVDQSRGFTLWSEPHDLATTAPHEVARVISAEILGVAGEG